MRIRPEEEITSLSAQRVQGQVVRSMPLLYYVPSKHSCRPCRHTFCPGW